MSRLARAQVLGEALLTVRRSPEAIERAQRRRLAELVAFARERSPYYRALYSGVPDGVDDASRLPTTGKPELLDRFDDWATDREVSFERVVSFTEDMSRIGESFLGRYLLVTSSGTSGLRGFSVMDQRALTVADALRLRALARWLGPRELAGLIRAGGRTAAISATHGHFTGAGIARRAGMRRRTVRTLSVLAPIPELVAELNAFRPAIVSGYASVITLLAAERDAGRLNISPVLIASSAEAMTPEAAERVAGSFGARHQSTYAAAECPFIAHTCARGWLHLNADWVVLEAVDADRRPLPAGEQSEGVLLTNLANRVQPRIRYWLDDRVLRRPDPCPCGSSLPAFRVEGRSADLMGFGSPAGCVEVSPQNLAMVLEGSRGIAAFQLLQTGPSSLRLRLSLLPGVEPEAVWSECERRLAEFLEGFGLDEVEVERAEEPPQQTEGGKMRKVVPLAAADATDGGAQSSSITSTSPLEKTRAPNS